MKLNIGGLIVKEGWKILNIQKREGVDYIGDISDLSRFEDNSIDEIYASHVVEHVPQEKIEITLKGIYRVLKSSGKFYVSVPDLDILFHSFRSTLLNIKIKKHILSMVFGGQDDQYDFHYYGYNFDVLEDYLKSLAWINSNLLMIGIKLSGGLGNNMFEYAAAKSLAKKNNYKLCYLTQKDYKFYL